MRIACAPLRPQSAGFPGRESLPLRKANIRLNGNAKQPNPEREQISGRKPFPHRLRAVANIDAGASNPAPSSLDRSNRTKTPAGEPSASLSPSTGKDTKTDFVLRIHREKAPVGSVPHRSRTFPRLTTHLPAVTKKTVDRKIPFINRASPCRATSGSGFPRAGRKDPRPRDGGRFQRERFHRSLSAADRGARTTSCPLGLVPNPPVSDRDSFFTGESRLTARSDRRMRQGQGRGQTAFYSFSSSSLLRRRSSAPAFPRIAIFRYSFSSFSISPRRRCAAASTCSATFRY